MNASRWIELISGIVAGAVGLIGLSYALYAPLGRYTSCDSNGMCYSGTSSLAQSGGMSPDGWFNMNILYLCLFAVIASAILHSIFRLKPLLGVLLCASGVVLIFTVLGVFTIGMYIAPAALLALAAAGLGLKVQHDRTMWG